MIIHYFQGVYLLTEVEENVAVIEVHSSLGWQSSGSVWECLTAAETARYLRNLREAWCRMIASQCFLL